MIYFRWYDHKAKSCSSPILDGLESIAACFHAAKIEGDASDLEDNTLAFIHPGIVEGEREKDWRDAARSGNNRYIVFVSSHVWSSASNADVTNVYCITQPLAAIAKYLSDKREKVACFIDSCKIGRPDWTVFEMLACPEDLVAWYLIEIAKQQNIEINDSFTEAMKSVAEAEYKSYAKAYNHDMPFETGVRALLQKVVKV